MNLFPFSFQLSSIQRNKFIQKMATLQVNNSTVAIYGYGSQIGQQNTSGIRDPFEQFFIQGKHLIFFFDNETDEMKRNIDKLETQLNDVFHLETYRLPFSEIYQKLGFFKSVAFLRQLMQYRPDNTDQIQSIKKFGAQFLIDSIMDYLKLYAKDFEELQETFVIEDEVLQYTVESQEMRTILKDLTDCDLHIIFSLLFKQLYIVNHELELFPDEIIVESIQKSVAMVKLVALSRKACEKRTLPKKDIAKLKRLKNTFDELNDKFELVNEETTQNVSFSTSRYDIEKLKIKERLRKRLEAKKAASQETVQSEWFENQIQDHMAQMNLEDTHEETSTNSSKKSLKKSKKQKKSKSRK